MNTENTTENENSSTNFHFKLYKLIILLFILSFIPLVSLSNKAAGGGLFSALILLYNFQSFSKGYSKFKIVLNTFIATLAYYLFTLGQTFFAYLNMLNEITKRVEVITDTIDLGFTIVNAKLLLMFIPLSICSIAIFRKGKLNNKLYKLAILINALIFMAILY